MWLFYVSAELGWYPGFGVVVECKTVLYSGLELYRDVFYSLYIYILELCRGWAPPGIIPGARICLCPVFVKPCLKNLYQFFSQWVRRTRSPNVLCSDWWNRTCSLIRWRCRTGWTRRDLPAATAPALNYIPLTRHRCYHAGFRRLDSCGHSPSPLGRHLRNGSPVTRIYPASPVQVIQEEAVFLWAQSRRILRSSNHRNTVRKFSDIRSVYETVQLFPVFKILCRSSAPIQPTQILHLLQLRYPDLCTLADHYQSVARW